MRVATRYDATNAAIFLPSGGSHRLRRELVDALDTHPGQRVLELGCGTGQVTAALTAADTDVVAVDAIADMLSTARRRAPTATFVHGDAFTADIGGDYDRVVLAFVLHNFDPEGRVRLLDRARRALAPDGRVGVLEWAQPHGCTRAALWRRFLTALEPSPTVTQVLDGALDADITAARLTVAYRRPAAGGRTRVMVLTRQP
jgi:demethylmenaquinone methyltransferase/2-methoxy-6-polyprenyl-1,4-benzoquinol methylase